MKLQGIGKRSCWYHDFQKGTNETLSPGKIIDIDIKTKEGSQEAFDLIDGLRAVPIDSSFIPEKSKYRVLVSFQYKGQDERMDNAAPGNILSLDRISACEFIAKGFIRPVDPEQWQPRDLIYPKGPVTDEIKTMYDRPEPKENWAMKGMKR
jgi:hypothetical protein